MPPLPRCQRDALRQALQGGSPGGCGLERAGKKLEVRIGLVRETGSQRTPPGVATTLPQGTGGQDGEVEVFTVFDSEESSGTRGLCRCRPAATKGTHCVVSWGIFLPVKTPLVGVEGRPVTWFLLEGEIKAHFRQRSKVGSCLLSHFSDFVGRRGCTGPQRNLPEMPAF